MREGVIVFAVMGLLVLGPYLFRRRREGRHPAHVPLSGGRLVLRTPRRNAVLLGITALFPAGLLGSVTARAWVLGQTGVAGLLAGSIATLLVVSIAVYAFAYALRAHLVVHDTGIERVGVFRRRLVGWGSIAKVAFNPAQHWLVVTTADRSHLWLPADIAGMGDFAILALRRLSPSVLGADPVVREVLEELAGAGA